MYKKPVHLGTSWPISTLPLYPAGHGFLCRLIPVFSCHHSPQRSPLWYSLPAGIWGARYLYPSPRCHFLFPAKPGKFAALAHIVSIFFHNEWRHHPPIWRYQNWHPLSCKEGLTGVGVSWRLRLQVRRLVTGGHFSSFSTLGLCVHLLQIKSFINRD
jgi:hypothetical protein